jgi:hypothetical protein
VPFQVAFGMTLLELNAYRADPIEHTAMVIVMSEFEGNQFNWHRMEWERKE